MDTRPELSLFVSILVVLLFSPFSSAQSSSSEAQTLFRFRSQLEYPTVIKAWNRYTDFCSLPSSPALTIVCTENRITELTVTGDKGPPPSLDSTKSAQPFHVSQQSLSSSFSVDSLFTTLSKLHSLEVLSLVSLGLWGPFPSKISRFSSLRALNLSSNFIYGQIPPQISSLSNLLSLVLDNNLLNGTVPDFGALRDLQELDLGNNLLGPGIPSLGSKLVSVILKNNRFRSGIPAQLKNFNDLQKFDVSSNKIVGPIPPPLFSLPQIQYLNLAGNQLSGALPSNITCNNELGFVDLSHNLLIGKLPACIRSNFSNRVVFYSWNCLSSLDSVHQHPHSSCHEEAIAAVAPPITKKTSKNKLALVLLICGGSLGCLIILGILGWLILRKVVAQNSDKSLVRKSVTQKAAIQVPSRLVADNRDMSQGVKLDAMGLPPYTVLTLEELEVATNNFDPSNLIGEESKGQRMYRGWLRDGSVVKIRCLKLPEKCSHQNLMQYTEFISKLRHRHVVSILGHYVDANTLYLVFESVSNGTLRSHLTERQNQEILKWPQRVSTVIGIARGIQFLHTGMVPGIFGNDLKIDNIVLDENLIAKISGYNLPLPSKDKIPKVGSESPYSGGSDNIGSNQDGEKEDIYQLGIILIQIVTGNPISSKKEVEGAKQELERSLVDGPMKLRAAIDSSMRGTFAYESVRNAVEIALNCLSTDISKRPSVEDILWNLQYCIQIQDGWTSSENLSAQSQRFTMQFSFD
ncbi:probable LRR receptor-like serine/threonine-protein kinase At1g14390 [Aristolochia californica]|uniref:probable LRR receptor-like serine/threonine-protein kinase At1g14390 n=1 Tax=Aristolochia californica TaxID=171875 RepID=UPI0035DEED03